MKKTQNVRAVDDVARDPSTGYRYYVLLTEGDAIDLSSGFVPRAVKARVLLQLDQAREDARRAARPVQKKKKAS